MSPYDTHEEELSDFEDAQPPKKGKKDSSNASKGKGRATSGNTSNAAGKNQPTEDEQALSQRKMQNRVAQREFRQRKLQYVKDLEARVEFLSTSHDDQLEALKAMLRGLLEENKQLRKLLQQVTGFVGQGLGGKSHELGFQNAHDFEEFVMRADRDTLHSVHEGWKTKYSKNINVSDSSKAAASGRANAGSTPRSAHTASPPAGLPVSTTDGTRGGRKRSREGQGADSAKWESSHTLPGLSCQPSQASSSNANAGSSSRALPNSVYSYATGAPTDSPIGPGGFFFDVVNPTPLSSLPPPNSAPTVDDFMSSFLHADLSPALCTPQSPSFTWNEQNAPTSYGSSMVQSPVNTTSNRLAPKADTLIPPEVFNNNPVLQAIHLISFHMRNKATDPSYTLPAPLQPTRLQSVTPHDSRIDCVIFPSLRDVLIASGDCDMNEMLPDMLEALTVHPGGDLLDPANWEITEAFAQKYKTLMTEEVVGASNRWRRSRGEKEIQL